MSKYWTQQTQMAPEDLHMLMTTKMPFGKHQGMLIADLPGNYLNWFAREGFPKGKFGQLLALMQEMGRLSHAIAIQGSHTSLSSAFDVTHADAFRPVDNDTLGMYI